MDRHRTFELDRPFKLFGLRGPEVAGVLFMGYLIMMLVKSATNGLFGIIAALAVAYAMRQALIYIDRRTAKAFYAHLRFYMSKPKRFRVTKDPHHVPVRLERKKQT